MQYILGQDGGASLVKDIGNIWFYIFTIILIVTVVVICSLFTRSKKFKIKMREKMRESQKEYEPPLIVKIEEARVHRIETELFEQIAQETTEQTADVPTEASADNAATSDESASDAEQ